jgi:hypothetical protein
MSVRHIIWTITPTKAPQPVLACNRCGGQQPYESSGKIRLNANGKKLDAWLIYHCTGCGNRWNRAIFERRNVASIAPAMLVALQRNEAEFVEAVAFDVQGLRAHTKRIEEFAGYAIEKCQPQDDGSAWTCAEVTLALRRPLALRADRLLAAELGVSRSGIERLEAAGRIKISAPHALRKPVADGMRNAIERAAWMW